MMYEQAFDTRRYKKILSAKGAEGVCSPQIWDDYFVTSQLVLSSQDGRQEVDTFNIELCFLSVE